MRKTIEISDWMVIINIIYKINSTEDVTQMRRNFLMQMKMILDFDSADFFLSKQKEELGLCDPVAYNIDVDQVEKMDKEDYSRGIMYSGKSVVYRESDIISEEARIRTEYYKTVYEANDCHYALQMILGYQKNFLGVATFYRKNGKEDFSYNDIFLVDLLKEHLAYRLYQDWKKQGMEKMTIKDVASKFQLTKREKEVVSRLITGKTNEDISEELSISLYTLKKHTLNIYRKLAVNSRIQLIKMIREK